MLRVEAILFSYGMFVEKSKICEILNIKEKKLNEILEFLKKKYNEDYSFEIEIEDNRVKMLLKKDYQNLVEGLVSDNEIPKNAIKVLSVIAYDMPITKTKLKEIVGRNVEDDLEYLFKEKFLTKQKVGIGTYYRVSKRFFDYFNLDEKKSIKNQMDKKLEEFS